MMFWVATPSSSERELEMWELHITFIFRAEQYAKAAKLSLLSDVFLQNIRLFPNDTALQPGRGKQKGLWNLNC
jgi:hypothetical protein